ncbi:uncharacterized protein EHS24_002297 [Apiotrichum porosum]|uniref:Uncharacterized protein n=1 Tax=Apiotrichum porosum TaxID=105984 RepID=A0A427XI68_9TREE|nr:uncharacterized protein EHS24_002297 [Apiotrichum porosum]RSH78570.1 hypothetical protein EHS24_002297 [Apiotrichum porosum]
MDVASFMFQRFRQCGHIVAIHVVEVDEQRDPLDSNNPRASGVGGVKISFDDQDSVRRALGLRLYAIDGEGEYELLGFYHLVCPGSAWVRIREQEIQGYSSHWPPCSMDGAQARELYRAPPHTTPSFAPPSAPLPLCLAFSKLNARCGSDKYLRRAGAASKVPFLPTLFEVESVPWVGEAFLYPYDSPALAKVRRNTVIKYRGESLPGAAYRAVTSIVSKTSYRSLGLDLLTTNTAKPAATPDPIDNGHRRAQLHHKSDIKHPGQTTKRFYGLDIESDHREVEPDNDPRQARPFDIRSAPLLTPSLGSAVGNTPNVKASVGPVPELAPSLPLPARGQPTSTLANVSWLTVDVAKILARMKVNLNPWPARRGPNPTSRCSQAGQQLGSAICALESKTVRYCNSTLPVVIVDSGTGLGKSTHSRTTARPNFHVKLAPALKAQGTIADKTLFYHIRTTYKAIKYGQPTGRSISVIQTMEYRDEKTAPLSINPPENTRALLAHTRVLSLETPP